MVFISIGAMKKMHSRLHHGIGGFELILHSIRPKIYIKEKWSIILPIVIPQLSFSLLFRYDGQLGFSLSLFRRRVIRSILSIDPSYLLSDNSILSIDSSYPLSDNSILSMDSSYPLSDNSILSIDSSYPLSDNSILSIDSSYPVADNSDSVYRNLDISSYPMADNSMHLSRPSYPTADNSMLLSDSSCPVADNSETG